MLSPTADINPTENRLEVAFKKGDYDHYLTYEDIADIARLHYADYGPSDTTDSYRAFEIIGSPGQLRRALQLFVTKANQVPYARLSLIVNIVQLHWVSLVVVSHHKNYAVYYIDSLKQALPPNYQKILEENNLHLTVNNLNDYSKGQEDDYNCGLWALENTEDLMRMSDEEKGIIWLSLQLKRLRTRNYFTSLRQLFAFKLDGDPLRQGRLFPLEYQFSPPKQGSDTSLPLIPVSIRDQDESQAKKPRLLTEAEKTREL